MNHRRILTVESLEARWLLAGDCWQNPLDHDDVNNDGGVTGEDIAVVLNHMVLENAGRELPQRYAFLDADGNGDIGPGDVASVVARVVVDAQRPGAPLEQRLLEMAGRHEQLQSLVDQYRGDDESISDTLERLLQLGGQDNPLPEQLESLLAEHEQFQQQLRQQLDDVLSGALEAADEVFADVQLRHRESGHGLGGHLAEHLENHLGEQRLHDRLNDLLQQLGASDVADQLRDFLDQVDSGVVELPDSVTGLLEQFRDQLPTLPDDLAGLVAAIDADQFRTAVVDLLGSLDNAGVELPPDVLALRDALLSGETPWADLVDRWIGELRDHTGSLQDLIDDVLGELAESQWSLQEWISLPWNPWWR
jgi:hypothetical protein